MSVPSTITDFDYFVLDPRQGALTTITLSWTSTQPYPSDLSLLLTFDPLQIHPKLPADSDELPCIINLTTISKCKFVYNEIFVSNLLPTNLEAEQPMQITITQMVIDVYEPITTETWTLTTSLNSGRYAIDQITSDLTVTFKCSYPCLTCSEDPTTCLSCNTVDGFAILYQEKCYQTCPAGTYFEYFQCKPCDPKCKTCAKTSGI